MKKKLIAMFAAMLAAMYTLAAVTITTSAKTFQKAGGAASVVVQGDGSWTATSDSSWIVIKSGASGTGAGSVVYVVNANATADVRIGHINIGGNTYTITQYGYDATISPTSATFDRYGGNGTISVTVDAGVSWSAVANNDWISVTPASGMSVGTVNYTVAEYPGVVSRVGSITIGGKTFTITQTGVDVSISPESIVKGEDADIIAVTINALATTQWAVTPNDPWISVIDKATGYGDYVLTLAINANPSFERRTGTVSIGTATLTISQAGTTTAALSIDPATATAAASGAYGNVAVYATPDAPWTAESTAPWLTISEGATGAGNGNIKYVASANPTLSERTGEIVITPPCKAPDNDINAGLIFEVTSNRYGTSATTSATAMDSRRLTGALPFLFTGAQTLGFSGTALPAKSDNSLAIAFSFSVGELDAINRIFTFGDNSLYFDTENRLCLNGNATGFVIDRVDVSYTILLCQNNMGMWQVWSAKTSDEELRCYYVGPLQLISCVNGYDLNNFVFGYATVPTTGYLTSGKIYNVRIWVRGLSEYECRKINIFDAPLYDYQPAYSPSTVWRYYPLDGNCYYADNTRPVIIPKATGSYMSKVKPAVNRFGVRDRAMETDADAILYAANVYSNNMVQLSSPRSDGYTSSYYGDATISCWMLIKEMPMQDATILEKIVSGNSSFSSFTVGINSSRRFYLTVENNQNVFNNYQVPIGEWINVTLSGRSRNNMVLYVNGSEIGNVSCEYSVGDRHYSRVSSTYCSSPNPAYPYHYIGLTSFRFGKINGCIDDFVYFYDVLSSAQVRTLYNASRPQLVVHTVTQGVQSAQVNKSKVTAPAEGSTESVALTLAQSVQWTAQSNSSWIQITSDTEGAGSASIEFTVGANPAVTSRTGSITVAGKNVTVVQQGLRASVECDDTSFGVESDSGVVWVETEGGGTWTASTDVDWIHLFDESGTGSTPVMFVVDDYTTTTASRSGTITIAGKKVVITQQGYELSIDPQVAEVGSNAGAGQFGVSAPIDAVWEAIADCDWITIIGARTGIGDGVIQYTIADNLTGETRTGRIVIAGKIYTITQKTTLPVTTKAIGSGSIVGAGNYNQGTSVTLTATPAAGYVFSHWSGDAVGVTNAVSISVDVPKEVTATFIPESAAEQLAAAKAAQGGFYTRDQIHALEVGNLVLDVDAASGTARVGVQLMETSDLSDPNSWQPVGMTTGNLDVGSDGTVGLNVPATGNAKFFKVVVPQQ